MLLLSGNIHINPGPVQYPCKICHRSVKVNQKGLLCDSCGLWSHIKCVNVSSECYDAYSQLDEFNWLCPICLFDQLPSSEVIDGNDDDICISADVPLSLPLPMEKTIDTLL